MTVARVQIPASPPERPRINSSRVFLILSPKIKKDRKRLPNSGLLPRYYRVDFRSIFINIRRFDQRRNLRLRQSGCQARQDTQHERRAADGQSPEPLNLLKSRSDRDETDEGLRKRPDRPDQSRQDPFLPIALHVIALLIIIVSLPERPAGGCCSLPGPPPWPAALNGC